jgi:hypothetical protein
MRNSYDLPRGQGSSNLHRSNQPKQKTIGAWNLLNVLDGIEAFTIALFTRMLGWSAENVQVLLADVRKDLRDPTIHAQLDL